VTRFPNGDDVLCLEKLRAVRNHSVALRSSEPFKVLILAEWDTLYGRSLAETFAALARPNESANAPNQQIYEKLRAGLLSQPGCEELLKRLPDGPPIRVQILPYLRGLDGASTLYRKAYAESASSESGKGSAQTGGGSTQTAKTSVETAEGTTQFDYIRRLIETDYKQHAPFRQRRGRPDAVIIFGTDIYDKLALLEFLRQELRNPLYLTTDLDALYWHPHYLKFTKDLVVASPFELEMSPPEVEQAAAGKAHARAIKSVAFRDVHQSAIYLAVCCCLDGLQIEAASFGEKGRPGLYQVGNSGALPVRFAGEPASGSLRPTLFFRRLDELWIALTQGTSICFSLGFQLVVIVMGLWAVFRDIPSRVPLSKALTDEIWTSAMVSMNDVTREKVKDLRSRIKTKWKDITRFQFPWSYKPPISQPVLVPVSENCAIGSDLDREFEKIENQIEKANYQADVASSALRLVSTLFCAQAATRKEKPESEAYLVPGKLGGILGRWCASRRIPIANLGALRRAIDLCKKILIHPNQPQPNLTQIYLGSEIIPFAKFVARDLSIKPCIVELYPDLRPFWNFLLSPVRWLDRRLPTLLFVLSGVLLLILLYRICSNPTAYLLGPETLSTFWRTARWLLETAALLVICAVFHRVCYEHFRFSELTKDFAPLIKERVALSNRQLVHLLAKASEPVANLALTPAALLLLIYISHLPFLGGAPLTFEMLCLLLTPLGLLAYSYARVMRAAQKASGEVKAAYDQEATDARRLTTRLQSYAKRNLPLQDDEVSLERDLQKLIETSSTSDAPSKIRPGDLRSPEIRLRCVEYLDALRERNRAFVKSLSGIREGLFAPLVANPMIVALLIPLGGAGSLNFIQWLISFLR
jgi:hypothetical protein